ncbi:unnamed protein product [Rhodiola kirilowii]
MAYIWNLLESRNLVSILLFILVLTLLFKWSRLTGPPSPPKLPIIGNLHQLGSYPHRTLRSLAKRYGPQLMLIHLGSAPAYVVSSANVAEDIMRTHDIAFSNRLESRIYKRLLYDCKDLLMAPYGEYWRRIRGICASQLLSTARVQSLQYIREEETNLMIQTIRELHGSVSCPFNLSQLLEQTTNDIVCRASLGKKYNKKEEGTLNRVFQEFNALLGLFNIGEYIPWLDWINNFNGVYKRVEQNYHEIDELLEEIIEDHLATSTASGNKPVLLDVLLDCQNSKDGGFFITRDSVKAIILDIFAGGSDTTYVVLEWAMTELLKHPEVLERVQGEVRGIIGDRRKAQISREDITKMSYLKAVIKESMRLHPSVPLIPRVSTQDVVVNGYTIPARTRVLINIWAIGTDPELWEEPDKFQPERFLNNNNNGHHDDFKWMAFGGGRRRCPGETFGMALVEFVLASLLYNFDWSLPDGSDLDMTEFIALALHRMHPLIAIATPIFSKE